MAGVNLGALMNDDEIMDILMNSSHKHRMPSSKLKECSVCECPLKIEDAYPWRYSSKFYFTYRCDVCKELIPYSLLVQMIKFDFPHFLTLGVAETDFPTLDVDAILWFYGKSLDELAVDTGLVCEPGSPLYRQLKSKQDRTIYSPWESQWVEVD